MFHTLPVELGWKGNEAAILARIKVDSMYAAALPALFPGMPDPFTVKNIQACISSFVKTIICFNAPYDRFLFKKDSTALAPAALKGRQLFFSNKLNCSQCHGGINFNTPVFAGSVGSIAWYQNTGLYNTDGEGSYPPGDQGLFEFTKNKEDMGKFRVPGLRNLAFTGPYLHDGSAASLEDLINTYAAAGRNTIIGANKGDGRTNRYKSNLIPGFSLSADEKHDLIAFLLALSDSSILVNKQYSNPFLADETHR